MTLRIALKISSERLQLKILYDEERKAYYIKELLDTIPTCLLDSSALDYDVLPHGDIVDLLTKKIVFCTRK